MTHSRRNATGSSDPAPTPAGAWLLVVVFVAGAALMAYEIVGARLLAPSFGNSTIVWGSLISVFLGALAVGYAVGGRIVDQRPHPGALAGILSVAAVLVGATVLIAEPLQEAVVDTGLELRMQVLLASVVLFGPASILIGMVSPFAVRLRAGDVATVGATAGALYGLSTAGSIVGTLAASFWLVQELGSETTVMVVAGALAACAVTTAIAGGARAIAVAGAGVATTVVLTLAILSGGDTVGEEFDGVGASYSPVFRAGGYAPEFEPSQGGTLKAKSDSSYHRIRVVDYPQGEVGNRPARVLHFDNSLQAAAPLVNGTPQVTGPTLFRYLRAWDMIPAIKPDAERVLLVGLGSGAAAMRLHELRPDLDIDVVEIDPEVVKLARRWFGYRDSENGNPRITTHIGDGRTWLAAQGDAKFDAIILDTYFADSIPFHLTTREFLELVQERLTDDGLAVANLIGAIEGDRSKLLRSMHATWAEVFEDVTMYPIDSTGGTPDVRNFSNVELFAGARGVLPQRGGEPTLLDEADLAGTGRDALDEDLQAIIDGRYTQDVPHDDVPVLTDDLAPVDRLMQIDGL